MNGNGPLLSLDPSADRVSYLSVLHTLSLDPNLKLSSRKTSIAGIQISNWMIVLGAVIVILLIYNSMH
jgi:hypothetical protein